MTNSTTLLDRRSPTSTAEKQLLSIANKSLYHHNSPGGERFRAKKGGNLPTLTREELTELIKHGLSATIDEELFMMKTSSNNNNNNKPSSRRRGSHHRANHHLHHHSKPLYDDDDQPQDGTGLDAAKVKRRKSAEEIFYATINGEELSVSDEGLEEAEEETWPMKPTSSPIGSPTKSNKNEYEDSSNAYYDEYDQDDDGEFPDSHSFANFDLIKDERMGELLKHDIPVDFFTKKSSSESWNHKEARRNQPGASTASPYHEGSAGATGAEENGSSGGEETTTASCSSIHSSDEDDLSITDIKQYVMDHLSEEVKSMIPEETWTRILSKFDKVVLDNDEEGDEEIQSVMTTNSTKDALKRLLKKSRFKKPDVDIDVVESCEDTTIVSDVTAHTAIVKKEEEPKNKKQVSFQAEDEVKQFGYPSPLGDTEPKLNGAGSGRKEASVKFSHVDVRHYERILEVNPSVTSGPPIGIGWRYRKGTSYTVDEWEMERRVVGGKRPRTAASTAVGPRSTASHLILPRAVREQMLFDLGYTQQDIAQALRTVRRLKDQRRTTVDNLSAQSVEEAVEKATNLMKNMLRVGRKRGVVR